MADFEIAHKLTAIIEKGYTEILMTMEIGQAAKRNWFFSGHKLWN